MMHDMTFNQRVIGSNPIAPTKVIRGFRKYREPGCKNRESNGNHLNREIEGKKGNLFPWVVNKFR